MTTSNKNIELCLLDPTLERTFRGHKSYITSVSFSPKLKQLASGSGDNNIMLWNFKPQLRAFRFIGHTGVVTDLGFSPHGDLLASASKDRTVRLWIPSAKGESVTLKGHAGPVRSVKFSKDSRHLVTASDDKTCKVWSLPSRKFSCSLVGHSNWVRSACFNGDANLVASGGDDKLVKLWDVPTHTALHTFHDHGDVVNDVMFHTEGQCLASCSADRSIKMWDIRSHLLIQHYPAHDDEVCSLSMHSSGYYLLSSSKDSSLKIWDLREGRLLFTLQGHQGAVNAAQFSNDGHFFASGGADQLVMVWKSNLYGVSAPDIDWGMGEKPLGGAIINGSMQKGSPASPMPTPAPPLSKNARSTISKYSSPPRDRHRRSHDSSLSNSGPGKAPNVVRKTPGAGVTAPPFSPATVVGRTPSSHNLYTSIPPPPMPHQPAVRPAQAPHSHTRSSYPESESKARRENARSTPTSVGTMRPQSHSGTPLSPGTASADHIPASIATTLDHIVGQLDILTKTMGIMEERLSLTESRVSSIISMQRGIPQAQSPEQVTQTNSFAKAAATSAAETADVVTAAARDQENLYPGPDSSDRGKSKASMEDEYRQHLEQQQSSPSRSLPPPPGEEGSSVATAAASAAGGAAARSGMTGMPDIPSASFRLVQLRVMCRQRGIDAEGSEADLIRRLNSKPHFATSPAVETYTTGNNTNESEMVNEIFGEQNDSDSDIEEIFPNDGDDIEDEDYDDEVDVAPFQSADVQDPN